MALILPPCVSCIITPNRVIYYSSVIDSNRYHRGSILGRLGSWSKTAEKGTSEIEPARRLPTIGLSHLPVRKKIDPSSRFNTDLYGKSRTKPRMQSEIRRVLEAWNTPAHLVAFPTIRYVYETSAYSKHCETNSRYTNFERSLWRIWTKDAIGEWRGIVSSL